MRLSAAGLTLIKRSEGFRGSLYKDTAGLETIGYGHKVISGENFSRGIDQTQAETILAADVSSAEASVTRLVKVKLTQGQFDAMVDFVFNLGAWRLANSTLLKDLNAGSYEQAAEQLLLWDHCGETENAGLKARRESDLELWSGTAAARLAAA
jgi:lysozyme